jgi:hypothetical protein
VGYTEKLITIASFLSAEYFDPATPSEVVVTDQIRPPVTDSTSGSRWEPRGLALLRRLTGHGVLSPRSETH